MHASKFQMQAGILTIKRSISNLRLRNTIKKNTTKNRIIFQNKKTAGPVPKIQSLISPIKPSRHTQAFQQKHKMIKHCLSI